MSGVAQTDWKVEGRSGRGFLRLQLAGQWILLGAWESLAGLVGEEHERCRVGKAEYTCQKPAGWAFETGCVAYWSSTLSNGRICDSRKDYTVLVKVLRLCDEQNDLNRGSSRSAVDEAHLSTTVHMT